MPAPAPPALRVLSQTSVPQKDGGSVTFQRVEPPVAAPRQPPRPEVLTAEELAARQRLEGKEHELVSISASVHEGGLTLLRCAIDGRQPGLEALSNVDFRLLAGIGSVETETKAYTLVMAVGEDSDPLPPAHAALAPSLAAMTTPTFALPDAQAAPAAEKQRTVTALEALHRHFESNRDLLVQRRARMMAEQAAREQALRDAPAPPPQHVVIRFWKLPRQEAPATPPGPGSSVSKGGESRP